MCVLLNILLFLHNVVNKKEKNLFNWKIEREREREIIKK